MYLVDPSGDVYDDNYFVNGSYGRESPYTSWMDDYANYVDPSGDVYNRFSVTLSYGRLTR